MHFIDKNHIQKTGYELNLHKPFPLGYPVLRPKGKGSFQICTKKLSVSYHILG